MKSESFLRPLRTRCKKHNGRRSSSSGLIQLQPSPPTLSNTPHSKNRKPHIEQDCRSGAHTHTAIKAHFHRLIHSAKHTPCHQSPSPPNASFRLLDLAENDDGRILHTAQNTTLELIYEHELVDGVVSDVERGEVCVVLEVGVARVVGLERVPWWEVRVVDLERGERGIEKEAIGRAF